MKKIKKIIILVLLIIVSISLSSCTRQSDIDFIEKLLDNNPYKASPNFSSPYHPMCENVFDIYAYYKCNTVDEVDDLLEENNLVNGGYYPCVDIRNFVAKKSDFYRDLGIKKCEDIDYYGVYISEDTYRAITNRLPIPSRYLIYEWNEIFCNYSLLYEKRELIKDYIDLDEYDCTLHYVKLEEDYAKKKIDGYRLLALMLGWKQDNYYAFDKDKLAYSIYDYMFIPGKETEDGLHAYEENYYRDPRGYELDEIKSQFIETLTRIYSKGFPLYPNYYMVQKSDWYRFYHWAWSSIKEIDGIECLTLEKSQNGIGSYDKFLEIIKDYIVKEEVLGGNYIRYYIDCYRYIDFIKEIVESQTIDE